MRVQKTMMYFILLVMVFLNLGASNVTNDAGKSPIVTFNLINNNTETFSAQITVKNLSHAGEWQLAFNSIRPILSMDNGTFLPQSGDFYLHKFIIPAGTNSIRFNLTGKYTVNKYTDAPLGYFLIENKTNNMRAVVNVNTKTILPDWSPNPDGDEHTKNQKKNNTSIEGNPVDTTKNADETMIVPLPTEVIKRPGEFVLNRATTIFYQNELAYNAANFFANAIFPATGFQLTVRQSNSQTLIPNSIILTTNDADTLDLNQSKEGYILEVTRNVIVIRAKTSAGFFYGLQSLRQLLPPEIFNHRLQPAMNWKIPAMSIRDYPRFSYRGLQLDVARHFVSKKDVLRLLDLMAIHKLNYFEWHLTDDEAWRIEIKRYPELTNIGAWRGYDPNNKNSYTLMPAFGSGAKNYGGFYTQDDIREIVKYAAERQITIIPEIDVPGHARAMIMSLRDQLIDKSDTSVYTSVQGYHDNILSPCKKETFEVLDTIMTEVAALFPGKIIHIGGDEVPKGVWEKSCMAKKYNPQDPNFKELVQNEFTQKVQQILMSKGKIVAGWEEVAGENMRLQAPLSVYIWNAAKIDQAYQKSAREGYDVIMSVAENLYFDLSYNQNPKEPGQYWAGYVDTFSPYQFKPVDTNKQQSEFVIKGVQGQLWSEQIDSPKRLDYFAFPKVAGLSELAWTQKTNRNWRNFSERMREKHLPRLQQYGVQYRAVEFAEIAN